MPWVQPGRVYRALRLAKRLKQREVGELLGVEQGWVSQVETGRMHIPTGWTGDEERRIYDEQPERWEEQPADRTMWDDVLALGTASGETRPSYAVGILPQDDGLPVLAQPPVTVRDRDAADAVAEQLAWSGVPGVAVVPVWSNWIREHGGTSSPGDEPFDVAVERLRRAFGSR